jgi:tetratricopeptide (TPR) repeat protein
MEELLIAVSVYREAADANAILFQLGEHDWTAARAPDRRGPAPPYQPPPDLQELIASSVAAELLSPASGNAPPAGAWVVDSWLAAELHRQLTAAGRRAELVAAHRRAAEYWQWRSAAWPQGRRQDLHDLLEARHHLFSAGDAEQASDVTRVICAQLHAWGDLGREAELIQATLDLLPGSSASWASWMQELGAIHQVRSDHDEAQRCYTAAIEIFAILGDYRGVARGQHSLGVLAQAAGDYRRAERHYRRSSAAESRADQLSRGDVDGDDGVPDVDHPSLHAADRENGEPDASAPGTSAPDAVALEADEPAHRAPAGRGRADATTPIRLVVTGEASEPQLHLVAEVHKPAAPDLLPVTQPRMTAREEVSQVGPDQRNAGPATATRHVQANAHRSRANAHRSPAKAPLSPAVPRLASSGAAAAHPAARLSGRAGRVLLVLGLIAAAIAVLGMLLARPAVRLRAGGSLSPGAVRLAAAAWVASQVSRSAVVGCDPAMCAALARRGVPAGDLLGLGPGGPDDPLAANVVIATAALRAEFGARLASAYAPEVLAAFGAGTSQIAVRAVAPDGVPAFLAAISSDVRARRQFGASLLRNRHLQLSERARAQMADGAVDSRLLATLAMLADLQSVRIITFGDAGPHASAGVPLRSVVVAPTGQGGAGWARSILAFLAAQQPPFQPAVAARIAQAGSRYAVRIEFASPSPLGLLTTPGSSPGLPSTHE